MDLGTGGTLGLAQGRTGEAGKSLLSLHESSILYVAMDLSAPYRSGVPAGATVIADAFHLVKLANKKIDDAFRRLSYRTEHPHEELGLPRPLHYMLRYNIENLDPDHLGIIIDTLDGDADGQQIAAVWIAKEHLRALLALRITKTHVTPAPSAGPRQARRLLRLVRGPPARPRAENPRRHHHEMAAARHRRRAHRLLERESGSTQPHRQNGRPHRTRIRQPRKPGPPRPHGHYPRRPAGSSAPFPTAVTGSSQSPVAVRASQAVRHGEPRQRHPG